ncbi:MAG: 16S rRNA (uracil(1498)-N(3))-methyltransferase [Verrucomicrobiales bacterium]|nr:16S rRNA (uracil(1498)-N(3))-methyltransferase [Verrucomicrobiales bacterium]
MHRFFTPGFQADATEVVLPEAEAHHAVRVLRIRIGDPVVLLTGSGGEWHGRVLAAGKSGVRVGIEHRIQHPPRPQELILLQAIAKGPAMEGLLHRAVELGCSRVLPLLSERSVSRPDDPETKRLRWQGIAHEAAKQSGNPWRMEVGTPITPGAWLQQGNLPELLLVASLIDSPTSPSRILDEHRSRLGRLPASLGILIGPEGDFSEAEYHLFRDAGARAISLGPHVLRVETAVTAALAVLQAALVDLRSAPNP